MTSRERTGPKLVGRVGAGHEAGVRISPSIEEIAPEFTTEELIEFLEADPFRGGADPAFRDRLRDELWALVQRLHRPPRR